MLENCFFQLLFVCFFEIVYFQLFAIFVDVSTRVFLSLSSVFIWTTTFFRLKKYFDFFSYFNCFRCDSSWSWARNWLIVVWKFLFLNIRNVSFSNFNLTLSKMTAVVFFVVNFFFQRVNRFLPTNFSLLLQLFFNFNSILFKIVYFSIEIYFIFEKIRLLFVV